MATVPAAHSIRQSYAETDTLARRLEVLLPPLLSNQRSSWEQGAAAQALFECHLFPLRSEVLSASVPLLSNLLPYIYALAHDSIVRQASDGRLSVLLNGNGTTDLGALDPACIGESIYYLCGTGKLSEHDQARFLVGTWGMLTYILDHCPRASLADGGVNLLSHRIDGVQIWSDAVYMLSPFLVASAAYIAQHHDPELDPLKLLRMGLEQVILAAQVLQSTTGEWSHIYDLEKRAFKRKEFWGVGNGWVCGGIIRIFRTLSAVLDGNEDTPLALALITNLELVDQIKHCYDILQRTLDACLKHVRSDGLFHNIIDDPTSFIETNLSQQVAYTLYRLLDLHLHATPRVREGLNLPEVEKGHARRWEGQADLLREAAVKKTDEWGFVRGVCGSPSFGGPGTATEGQSWAVLMEVARAEYLLHKRHAPDDQYFQAVQLRSIAEIDI